MFIGLSAVLFHLNFTDSGEKIKNRDSKKDSKAQRIIDWIYEQPKGREFKISAMLKELGLSQKNFDDAKRYNKSLVTIFRSMATDKKGYYRISR